MRALTRLLSLLVVLALAGEGWARFVMQVTPAAYAESTLAAAVAGFVEADPVTGIRYKANVDALLESPEGEFSALFKTNEINLRDRSMGTHLRSELKFLLLGDEFAEGWGVEIDEAAAVIAQKAINEKTNLKPAVRLVIGAKSGYGAAQNYLQGKALIEALQPKAVVFLYSSLMPYADQEFLASAQTSDGLATGTKAGTARFLPLEDYPPPASGPLASLAPYSAAARALSDALRQPPSAAGRLLGVRGDAAALANAHAASLKHVAALAALAKEKDIPFLLVHVPLPPQVSRNEWPQGRLRFGVADMGEESADASVVGDFCAGLKLRCLDARAPLQQAANSQGARALFFATELGLTPEGNRTLGLWLSNTLMDWMAELGWR